MRLTNRIFFICLWVLIAILAGGGPTLALDRSNTTHAVAMNGRLYTTEKGGELYSIDLTTGKGVELGRLAYGNPKFLVAAGNALLAIDNGGSLYRVNTADASSTAIGQAGDRRASLFAATIGDKLYTVEASGVLHETNTSTGAWKQIGKSDFLRTKFLLAGPTSLYSLENDGNLYAVSTATGSLQQVGHSNDWVGTRVGTVLGGKLYTIEGSGSFFETDLQTGAWKQLGKREFVRMKFIFGAGTSLFSMEFEGTLYRIDTATGTQIQIL